MRSIIQIPMVDTCDTVRHTGRVWIHRGIALFVPLWLPWAPADSIIEVPWTAVDTQWIDYRATFPKIYDSVGPFVLRELRPDDTSNHYSHWFDIRFYQYTPADTVYHFLGQIRGVDYVPAIPVIPGGSGVAEPAKPGELRIYPNPVSTSTLYLIAHDPLLTAEMVVADALGRVIRNVKVSYEGDDRYTLTLPATLSSGIYFIRFGNHVARFVKN